MEDIMPADQTRPLSLTTSIAALLSVLLLGAADVAQARSGGGGGGNRSAAVPAAAVKPAPPHIPITNGPIKPLPPRLTITNGPLKQPTPVQVGCGGVVTLTAVADVVAVAALPADTAFPVLGLHSIRQPRHR